MGTVYCGEIAVGFRFSSETLTMPFEVHREEVSHMEDRFDPKTGKKLPEQEKVIDEDEEVVFILDGEEHDYEWEFFSALCDKLGCSFSDMDFDENSHSVFLSVKSPDTVDPGVDFGHVEFGGSYQFKDIVGLKKELTRLRKALGKIYAKSDIPEPEVAIIWSVG